MISCHFVPKPYQISQVGLFKRMARNDKNVLAPDAKMRTDPFLKKDIKTP